jgi:hypothetical protein
LEIDFDEKMLDHSLFRGADGSPWPSSKDVYASSADSWRQEMPRPMLELTELICGPEMALSGYEPYVIRGGINFPTDEAFDFAIKNSRECLGWNTDFSEIEHTLGCELYRRRMLTLDAGYTDLEIERSFLSVSLFNELKAVNKFLD